MKNTSKLLPSVLLLLFVVLACNRFTKKETEIVEKTPAPTVNLDVYPTPNPASEEILNAKAASLPQPVYPKAAKAVNATGAVSVEVEVDEKGNVTTARAASGHPLLRASAEQAAKQAKFKPSTEKIKGVIVYNFKGE